jgi:hypothetical protein
MPARETERLDRSEQINSRMMLSLREASYGGAAMGHIYPSARDVDPPVCHPAKPALVEGGPGSPRESAQGLGIAAVGLNRARGPWSRGRRGGRAARRRGS